MATSVNTYCLPLKRDTISDFHEGISFSHTGRFKHAIDFACKEGTPVFAARGGIVTFVEDSFSIGGLDKKYWDMGNRIVIRHENAEYTAYEHLQYRSALVTKGQLVKLGDQIATSGNTGYSSGPHLHFEVFTDANDTEVEGETLKVTFEEDGQKLHD